MSNNRILTKEELFKQIQELPEDEDIPEEIKEALEFFRGIQITRLDPAVTSNRHTRRRAQSKRYQKIYG